MRLSNEQLEELGIKMYSKRCSKCGRTFKTPDGDSFWINDVVAASVFCPECEGDFDERYYL